MLKIGVISDTHGYLDPRVADLFQGVDHILHAGDIGFSSLIVELEAIAPVTAVLGNNDLDGGFRETELVTLETRRFLVHHIVNPRALTDSLRQRLLRDNPDVVVFGHTHQPFCGRVGGTLYLNPGYAGKPRFGQPRSVALATLDGGAVHTAHLAL